MLYHGICGRATTQAAETKEVLFALFMGLHKTVENPVENVQNLENQAVFRVTTHLWKPALRELFCGEKRNSAEMGQYPAGMCRMLAVVRKPC